MKIIVILGVTRLLRPIPDCHVGLPFQWQMFKIRNHNSLGALRYLYLYCYYLLLELKKIKIALYNNDLRISGLTDKPGCLGHFTKWLTTACEVPRKLIRYLH